MNSKVILVVEDDFLNRRLTKKILQENEYQVLEAKNADEALTKLEKESKNPTFIYIAGRIDSCGSVKRGVFVQY